MEISELTFKLIMLFIPGAVASIIVEQLTIHKEWNAFRFITNSVVLGILSYLLLQIIYLIPIFNETSASLDFWHSTNNVKSIPFLEILFSSLIGIVLGFIITLGIQKKWLFKIASFLKVSYKYGDECLFYYFLDTKDLSEIYVRDFEQKLTYHGFIQTFSESELERELVLKDVDVYTLNKSKLLYHTEIVFISKPKSSAWQIEMPDFNSNLKNHDNGKKSN